MVDVNSIIDSFVTGLSSHFYPISSYSFQRANDENNLPPYPCCIVNCMTPYKRDKDDIRGTITHEAVSGDDTKIKINREEEPQMVFSFNAYSDKQDECSELLKDVIDWLVFGNQQYLESCGITIVDVGAVQDRTTWLETGYQYHYGFDVTIRVYTKQTIQVDTIGSVETTNLTV